MKKEILSLFVALMATATVQAQQIAVVTGSTTKMCQTLADAIGVATNGSVIYLPGGGFQISDDVKITKRVSIIGIGHKSVSENADGNTVISGNLYFNDGSDGSAVMGCYISGGVLIGYDNKSVNNIIVKLCNLNYVRVYSTKCTGTEINQNYIRTFSSFNHAPAMFSNNIAHSIVELSGGQIINNIIVKENNSYYGCYNCDNSTIANNIIISSNAASSCADCVISQNMRLSKSTWSQDSDPINITASSWNDVFENYNSGTISPASDFHFKNAYKEYESQVGVYAGTGFGKDALPPVPYIVSKNIASQTDAAGKLKVQIRVKAGE